ncbi:hypothetical protein KR093_003770 [Drosophila rubida]|uniref:Transcription factor CBF/NF-Y/archaeal histone domain-containing protein n=1 Tax=Drosophila rubida TaxID=30044 RepID=A0AAD4K7T7_9MUSC|nr:hypothetical protein KR093_003770 [Drosophila rubida]
MPSKKKKYNARFPAGRIKKIMQSDEEVGKVAQAVPIIISRTLELFVESLLTKTLRITTSRNAKTLSPSHMKQCIMSEQRFDFLKELVRNIPDISVAEEACNYNDDDVHSSEEQYPDSDTPYDLSLPSTSIRGLHNGNSNINSNNTYARSLSLNGVGLKRNHNPAPPTPPVIMKTAALAQVQQQLRPLAPKLARSESTPAYTPRGRPPNNNSNNNSVHYSSSRQLQTPETAIPAPICTYDVLSKPIVKIDYSNVQMPTTTTTAAAADAADTGNAAADTAFNFDIAAPVINIDLSNIVSAGTTTTQPTANICYGLLAEDNTSVSVSVGVGVGVGGNNNSISKINCIGGKRLTPIIPKPTSAPAPITESLFELDEDYDNI